jgi:hypothetical protein
MAPLVDERGLKVTTVNLPAGDVVALRELAKAAERTLSAQVRIAVTRHLEEEGRRREA